MDAKEILRLAIQNRFWIVVGISAILPMIAYFVTAGSISEATETKASEIKSSKDKVNKYTSGTVVNSQYKPFTQEKIARVNEDVDAAWRRLYERQAPLLDWPESVEDEILAWGREYPEGVQPSLVQAVVIDYMQNYEDFAKKIYESFKPWNPEDGSGIVVAPAMEALLAMPPVVNKGTGQRYEVTDLPTLGKIWQYQENLWVRRTILDVIAKVNEKARATNWEEAPIKKIEALFVGSSSAVDHQSQAEGIALQDAPEIAPPGQETAAPKKAAGGMSMPGEMAGMTSMEDMMRTEMSGGGMYGPGGGMGGGMAAKKQEKVQFIQPEGVSQYRVYPAMVEVLIDQNAIPDFLVEFENSPMSIQVKEIKWQRPETRVEAPEVGKTQLAGMMGYGGMMDMGVYGMPGMEMMGMMGGYGGMMDMGMYEGMMPGGMEMGMMGMPGYGGRGGPRGAPITSGRSKVQRKVGEAEKKEEDEKAAQRKKREIFDPYYNVVKLTVYCQARFYNPPPPPGESPEVGTMAELDAEDLDAIPDDAIPDEDAELLDETEPAIPDDTESEAVEATEADPDDPEAAEDDPDDPDEAELFDPFEQAEPEAEPAAAN